jgi:predicted transposase YdaD
MLVRYLYKLPELNREETLAMFQVHDIRQSRVYKEAVEEGIQLGIEIERQRRLEWKSRAIPKLAARQMSAAEIADIVSLDVELVRQQLAKSPS